MIVLAGEPCWWLFEDHGNLYFDFLDGGIAQVSLSFQLTPSEVAQVRKHGITYARTLTGARIHDYQNLRLPHSITSQFSDAIVAWHKSKQT